MGIYGNVWSFSEHKQLFHAIFRKVMARKKISTTVYVTPEQNEALQLLNDRTKVPVAVFIREGIDLVLAKHSDQLPGQLNLVETSDSSSK